MLRPLKGRGVLIEIMGLRYSFRSRHLNLKPPGQGSVFRLVGTLSIATLMDTWAHNHSPEAKTQSPRTGNPKPKPQIVNPKSQILSPKY